jgi:DHA1 family bicyclomycin/chloramphenicol resistance-like MFS transporter
MALNLGRLLRNRAFLGYGLCVLLTMGALMAFLASASSVVILFLGLSPFEFALAHGAVMVGYSLFGYLAGRLVGRFGIDRLVALGTAAGAASGLAMLGLALAGIDTLWAIMVPMFGFMAAFSFVVPAATAGALSPFGDMAGTAMANLAFFQTCFSALVAFVVGQLFDGTQMPMVATIGALGVAAPIAYLVLIGPGARPAAA